MEPMSAHVQELMDKVDEHNAKRAYKRRDSVSELLRQSPPLLITIYRQDDTCVKSSSIDDSDIFSSRSQSPSSPPLEHLSRSPSPPPAATAPVPLMP
ncbi:hypothetical protein PTSG_11657 [Salpingoeca rosetta]|uniref:Uncharacterized protein n=1 Tax=Salpingoeca rosetta (strain ATCC 50818 / BSB-021) TaxID=946362 RepID=F2TXV2_SALR5|nr:uncharacterized protein PTSG_11657 [Salpingoeca rosetta]EGD76211.1 hypothetical protein PTSG_11657 [Salpingoeca rosetta]|eukprot:XP_004998386.1 hypothetical protein PTSG_11657 [Salpingoeca rosetta]